MGHDHDHSHAHTSADTVGMSDGRLLWAIAINGLLTAVQVVGGLLSGSLSLLADALHNLSDAGALVIALVARRIGRKPADSQQTFGYRRAELVGALINATTLNLVGLYLAYQAVLRLGDPPPVAGGTIIIVAGVALAVDVATALLTYRMSQGSLNVRAAFVHNVTDALGSVAVIVAGVLILRYQLYLADVVATFLIAGYALYHGVVITRQASQILTLGVPRDIQVPALVAALRQVDGVADVHHLHVWQLDESQRSFEGHVVVDRQDAVLAERVKGLVRAVLARHGITHSTIECEYGAVNDGCREGQVVVPH
jgi:cobalt-zinc-cadmium efflux system protein